MGSRALEGKVAVVTGAGRGIGRAVAEGFGRAGASVVCAARTRADLQEVADAIRGNGGRAAAVETDVTRREDVTRLFARTREEFGGLDILLINAGGNLAREAVEESDPEAWTRTVELNLFGAYYCARAAVPLLRERGGGKILTMGSGLGHKGGPRGSAYSCAKAGLWMLTRVLAQELWQYNISVNEIIPGPVRTGRTARLAKERSEVFAVENEWVKDPPDVLPLAMFLATQPLVGPTAQSYSLMRRDT